MLEGDSLRDKIIAQYDGMSPQLQQAARYVLENPQEVALTSMRRLARNAAVQPATMTRLAQYLGLTGYEDIRAHYAKTIRMRADGFAARAMERETASPDEGGGLARQMLQSLAAQISRLSEPQPLAQLQAVADHLHGARRIYVLGLRSCHSVAWHFHYVMTLLGEKTVHLDGPAGTSGDGLLHAGDKDVLLAISVSPYALHTLELAAAAREKGMAVIAITDSEVSPLASISQATILCPTESQTFFHTLTPALAISEVLCGLLAAHDRQGALEALQKADEHLQSLNIYANTIPRRRI
ncbi:MurR/RpiR family transcriptional regulator [Pseudorhodobacter turbinis]|uniref:MurR/RpiR family transcriptional regulator n=1 Tax=Pseudorhodobacter turbinis TaxID=2500533 RepID=A0A4P8ED36_9RHOB|nr:MurR/RpiR family transcriptional regulator [Pseudorhodobacter turbinis]QCO54801.1 MurR/RpiR family transcriptional regulator [Pseudorhodobacter turbinis]